METIEVSESLLSRLGELRKEGEYESLEIGLEQAVEHHLSELRKNKAKNVVKRIRKGLVEQGHTEDEIVKDFEIFRQRLTTES